MKSWEAKNVWITGGSSGLGLALAHIACGQGAKVLLLARDKKKLESAQKALGQHAVIAPIDLTDSVALPNEIAKLKAQYGAPNILINNAGLSQRAYITDTTPETDQRLFAINYFAPRNLTSLLLSDLLQCQGHVITIASMAGKLGSQGRASYAASKHAIVGWMDCLRSEVHDRGVRISVANPSFIATNLAKSALTGAGDAYGKTDSELGSGKSAEQMAELIVKKLEQGLDDFNIAEPKIRWAQRVYRLHPSWYHWLVRKFYKRDF